MKEKVTVGKIWGVIYPMLLYTGITLVITNLIAIILTIMVTLSGDMGDPNLIATKVTEGLYSQIMLVTLCSALATLPFVIFFRYRDIQREKLNNRFKKYKRVFFLKYLLIVPFGILCMLSANYFVSILTTIMPDFMTDSYQDTAQAIYGTEIGVQILTAGIVGPVVEEMIFRGLIFNRIKKMSNVMAAALISSILFGVYHGNWVQAPYAFIIGMVCVYVYEKYKSIAAPIILHMSANLLSVIVSSMVTITETGENTVQISELQQVSVYMVMTVVTGALAVGISLIINKTVKPKEIHD
ncbi:MAG: lysostaphin resistance A-like protein [Eubacterium sp.]